MTLHGEGQAVYETVSPTRFRRATAKAMLRSHAEKPPVTLSRWVVAEPLLAHLAQLGTAANGPARPTLTAGLVALTARALRSCPTLNTVKVGDEIRRMSSINVCFAVATDSGLVSPVIRDADTLNIREIAGTLETLAPRARAGQLGPEDVADGTFTISSLGRWDVEFFTPIVVPPQTAILGVGRLQRRPHEVAGTWEGRSELPVSLTFDHTVADGIDGASFLQALNSELQVVGGHGL